MYGLIFKYLHFSLLRTKMGSQLWSCFAVFRCLKITILEEFSGVIKYIRHKYMNAHEKIYLAKGARYFCEFNTLIMCKKHNAFLRRDI